MSTEPQAAPPFDTNDAANTAYGQFTGVPNYTDQHDVSNHLNADDPSFEPTPGSTEPVVPAIGTIEGSKTVDAQLFQHGVLLHVSAATYSGQMGQDEEDMAVQGVEAATADAPNADQEIFKPGQKRLIRRAALEPFKLWRNRIAGFLDANSMPFLDMGGTRLVSRTRIAAVLARLEEFRNELTGLVDLFMGLDNANYVVEQNIQSALFNQRYPERTGYLTQFFLTPDQVRRKFRLSHKVFEISEVSDAERAGIAEEEKALVRQQMNSYNGELKLKVRQEVQKRLTYIVRALNVKGKINGERILTLGQELDEIEKAFSFSDDAQLRELIGSVRQAGFDVKDWKTDLEGKKALEDLVKKGDQELVAELEENGLTVVRSGRQVQVSTPDAAELEVDPETVVQSEGRRTDAAPVDSDQFEVEEGDFAAAGIRTVRTTPLATVDA